MGIFDVLKAAVIPAAQARAGYLEGQSQETDKQAATQRQSLLDQMKQAMDTSTVNENNARAKYYEGGGAGNDWGTPFDTSKGLVQQNRRTGEIRLAQITEPKAAAPAPSMVRAAMMDRPAVDENAGGRMGESETGQQGVEDSPTPSFVNTIRSAITPPAGAPEAKLTRTPKKPDGKEYVDPTDKGVYQRYSDGTKVRVRDANPGELSKATDTPAPKVTRSGSGYVQWDGASGKWVPSNIAGPATTTNSPEAQAMHRENQIFKRATDLQKPTTGKFGIKQPGLDPDAAIARASAEYDAAATAAGAPPRPRAPKTPALTVKGGKLSDQEQSVAQRAIAKIHTAGDYDSARSQLEKYPGVWAAIEAAIPASLKAGAPPKNEIGSNAGIGKPGVDIIRPEQE